LNTDVDTLEAAITSSGLTASQQSELTAYAEEMRGAQTPDELNVLLGEFNEYYAADLSGATVTPSAEYTTT
jgi:hypothetical protein